MSRMLRKLRSRKKRGLTDTSTLRSSAPIILREQRGCVRARTDGRTKPKLQLCVADQFPGDPLALKQAKENHLVWGKCSDPPRVTVWETWKQMARDLAGDDEAFWEKGPHGTFEVTVKIT